MVILKSFTLDYFRLFLSYFWLFHLSLFFIIVSYFWLFDIFLAIKGYFTLGYL
jgi:hypothetical protein